MRESRTRRTVLRGTGAAITGGVIGLAGCLDDGADEDEAEQAGAGLDGGDDDGDDMGGDDASDDGEEVSDYGDDMLSEEFDPENPEWEGTNYLGGPVVEANYMRGFPEDLEEMMNRGRDEPVYGEPPREPPEDEGEWLEPDTLLHLESPGEEDEAAFDDMIQPLFDEVEAETGIDVEWIHVDSYAAAVEAMRAERAHTASFATGNTPFAVNLAYSVPFACRLDLNGQFAYRLLAITQADNDEIQSVEDFAGKRIAHTEESSNSGHQAPSAMFYQQFDLDWESDYDVEFSGGHDNSARGIGVGDYEGGPICSTCWERAIEADDDLAYDDFKIVWASDPFPPGPMHHRYDLHPDIVDGFKRALFENDWADTEYGEARDTSEFVEIDYANVWHEVLEIQEYNNVQYEEGQLESITGPFGTLP